MARTKEELAEAKAASRLRVRTARWRADGFDTVELEHGLAAQCLTCARTWCRLTPYRQLEHRMICPGDPQLARFTLPHPLEVHAHTVQQILIRTPRPDRCPLRYTRDIPDHD